MERVRGSRPRYWMRSPQSTSTLKPADMTIAPFTPTWPHSWITFGTDGAGVTTTARSTGSGTSRTLLYARIPSTLLRFGLMGNTVPPNGVLIRFHNVVRPTLPGFSVAPITAMFRGVKKTSSGCTPCSRTEDGLPDAGLLAPGLLAKGIFGLVAPEI